MSDPRTIEARVKSLEKQLRGPSFRLLGLTDRVLRKLKRTIFPAPHRITESRDRQAPAASPATDGASQPVVFSRTSRIGEPATPVVTFETRPRVSVVMTTFNSADTIEEAIWSLLNQSYPVSEIIVVDDLSSDGTREIVARMAAAESRIRLMCLSQNSGTFWAKNTGLTVATGDVVTFMDSDDLSTPKRIETQLKAFSRKGVVATLCACVRVDETGKVILNRGLRSRTAPISLMFHRSVLRHVGYFDSVRTSADSEFQERLKATYGRRAIHQIEEPLYVARVRAESLSNDPQNSVQLSGEGGTFLSPARQAYQNGFIDWHRSELEAGRRPYVCFPVSERPFPVTGRLRVREGEDETTITAFMATFPPRLEQLKEVVGRLIGQVDHLFVYLNEYDAVPDALRHDRITAVVGGRNLRDAGKFFSVRDAKKGYWFFVDDDIAYPDDYCDTMVRAIERHKRKAIMGVHGIVLSRPLDRYFSESREVYRYQDAASERRVNLVGTGTAAMHSSVLDVDESALSSAGMADIWLGIKAKRAGVPMIVIGREKGWLQTMDLPEGQSTLFDEFVNRDEEQTGLLRAEGDWALGVDRLMDAARG